MPNRRTFIALAAATTAAAVFTAPAFAVGRLVDVDIVDRGRNEALPTHPHRGADWVAGRPGNRYAVRLSNRSGARVLVVLSIDGVNAVSGETAATGQTGYVLGPWQTAEITGWRKSLTEAAAFYFTALPDSYAARTGRPGNVGVIGAAVFREKEREVFRREELRPDADLSSAPSSPQDSTQDSTPNSKQSGGTPFDRRRESEASSARRAAPAQAPAAERNAAGASARDERLGTGHGEREFAPTANTAFERASERPTEVVRIRYDSLDNLVAFGIVKPPRTPRAPEPFPLFVPDPKG